MVERIGVIGDTHGLAPVRAGQVFEGVSRIIHAGDVGDAKVLDMLETIAPVTGVVGNYDQAPELKSRLLPDPSAIVVAGLQGFLTHRMIVLEWTMYKQLIADMLVQKGFPPRLFIFGHTHTAVLEEINGIWFINPGYAGPDQLEGPNTAIVLEVEGQEVSGEIVPL